jgi:hypothetical protein
VVGAFGPSLFVRDFTIGHIPWGVTSQFPTFIPTIQVSVYGSYSLTGLLVLLYSLGKDCIEKNISSIVAVETCLSCCCLAMAASSCSSVLAFTRHVTIWMLRIHCYHDHSAYGGSSGNKFLLKRMHVIAKLAIILGFPSERGVSFVFTNFFHLMPFGRNKVGWTDRWTMAIIQGLFQRTKGLVAPEWVSHAHPSQIYCSQMKEQELQQKQW